MCMSYPESISVQRSQHNHEERLLQQSHHCTDHRLQPGEGAKMIRRVPVRERETFVTKNHKTSHKGQFFKTEIYA